MSKVYVVGIGPGNYEHMTIKAAEVLKGCDMIVGYTVYVDLIKAHFSEKEMLTTPMRQEVQRCRLAFEAAAQGKTVAMICSGDPGVYGMAGLIYEIAAGYPDCEIEVVPGVTAALAGAAVLGAPLIHDACLISLSDLLTPWDVIKERLLAAAKADFVICLYNPASKKRADYLAKACDLILNYASEQRICGVAVNIQRQDQQMKLMTLAELKVYPADMFTAVFIGNSQTRILNGKMVTPRGYHIT